MKITVIIPIYNRFDMLWHTLNSLQNQIIKNFEVVLVDDGSAQDIKEFVENKCKHIQFKINIIKQKNSGASVALNTGLQSVTEGLIYLTDNDIVLLPDTLQKHVEFHLNHPNAILCGSARMDESGIVNPLYEYKYHMEQCWEDEIKKFPPPVKVNTDAFYVTTANTSFSYEVYKKIGKFNPEFRDGYDVEYCLRALKSGVNVFFDYRIRTIHNDIFSLRHYAHRQKAYITSKMKMVKRMPEYRDFLFKNYYVYIPLHKKIIYKVLRNNKIVDFIEKSKLISFLPKFIRYGLYGMCIAAHSLDLKNEIKN
jgi:glycosyltransferase involved in cell wall biosynthesis